MKRVSVGDVQHNFSRILRDVDAGEEVQIVRRKHVVARIVPDSDTPEPRFPEFVSRAREIFGEGNGVPVSDLILGDRDERL
jgi:antitoxin (DNA-binding transcriptional repressor) of toxin-antitoxin stability system